MKTNSTLEKKKEEFLRVFSFGGGLLRANFLESQWEWIAQAIKEAKEEGYREGYDWCDKGHRAAAKGNYEAILRKKDGALFIKTPALKSKPNK